MLTAVAWGIQSLFLFSPILWEAEKSVNKLCHGFEHLKKKIRTNIFLAEITAKSFISLWRPTSEYSVKVRTVTEMVKINAIIMAQFASVMLFFFTIVLSGRRGSPVCMWESFQAYRHAWPPGGPPMHGRCWPCTHLPPWGWSGSGGLCWTGSRWLSFSYPVFQPSALGYRLLCRQSRFWLANTVFDLI